MWWIYLSLIFFFALSWFCLAWKVLKPMFSLTFHNLLLLTYLLKVISYIWVISLVTSVELDLDFFFSFLLGNLYYLISYLILLHIFWFLRYLEFFLLSYLIFSAVIILFFLFPDWLWIELFLFHSPLLWKLYYFHDFSA